MNRPFRFWALGGVALLSLGLSGSLMAETPQGAIENTPQGAPGGVQEGAMALSLQDALKTAMQNNFDIRVDQVVVQETDWALKGAYGIYDTQLTFDWYNQVLREPTTSRLQVGTLATTEYMTRQDAYNLGLQQGTPWGQTFQFQWMNSRGRTNSSFSYLNPTYSSSGMLGTTLPLLQGFGKKVASQKVLQAKLDRSIADISYLQGVRDTLLQVEKDYFDLVYAIKDLKVKEAALDLAKRFQEETRKKIEVGVLAPIEQVTSDAQVATRDQDIITARQSVGDRTDILKLDLGISKDSADWHRPIDPTDEPQLATNDKPESQLIEEALTKRPEMLVLQGRLEKDGLALVAAKNQTLPSLNLNASLTYNGAAGTLMDSQTGQILWDKGLSEAWSQITGLDYKSYFVGLAFSYPLQNRAAKAQFQSSLLARTADEIAMEKLKLTIANEVRSGLRDLEAAKMRVAAAEVTFRLQKEKLEAEQKKYDNGLSTAFNVLTYQNDLLFAASSLLNARVYTQVAGAKLERALGRYLESRGIEIK
jgi:outer membrane protein TolC